ncbi:helix-turn-helix domain-containing protein [Halodesulfurarchaeum sp.]|uniref:helix-turn-helix domain-containing protein n=1 Tax=Halodesulfurarchaeum sp. TaxID=1980530 RepID=UPI001BBE0682|nr:helix-turn-helix domain-containing protein [Halodesulfurarchaeum sp.]
MAVIAELALPHQQFELGRILASGPTTFIALETIVPLGQRSVPFFRVYDERDSFERTVGGHDAVNEIQVVTETATETLYALDWEVSGDTFFAGLMDAEASVLGAQQVEGTWEFALRFPFHDALTEFQDYCEEMGLPIETERLFNSTRPEAGPWYGLTPPQRESLTRAAEAGYYSIPREISTTELAAEFGVSDQAMTERLRRGIEALVLNTLSAGEAMTDETAE